MKFTFPIYHFHGTDVKDVTAYVSSVNLYPRDQRLVVTLELYKEPATEPFTWQVVTVEATSAGNTDIKKAVLSVYPDAHAKRN